MFKFKALSLSIILVSSLAVATENKLADVKPFKIHNFTQIKDQLEQLPVVESSSYYAAAGVSIVLASVLYTIYKNINYSGAVVPAAAHAVDQNAARIAKLARVARQLQWDANT